MANYCPHYQIDNYMCHKCEYEREAMNTQPRLYGVICSEELDHPTMGTVRGSLGNLLPEVICYSTVEEAERAHTLTNRMGCHGRHYVVVTVPGESVTVT